MNLHNDKKLFSDTIRAAVQHLKINEVLVEKDYWITLVLNRFSEDVYIAIIHENNKSGNEIKNIRKE